MTEQTIRLDGLNGEPDITRGSISFIGTATVLIEVAGFRILTDPNFVHMHEKVPLGHGLEAERLTDPAMEIGGLPPLDCVVLSHFHGDHFDQVAERELPKDLLILCPPQSAAELDGRGFTNTRGLDTWDRVRLEKGPVAVRVTATPAKHGPALVDFALPDVMGSVLEFESPGGATLLRLYISGDTVLFDELNEIPRRHADINLALLHLGGTKLFGVLLSMDDEQGVEMLRLLRAQMAIPIHYDDYDVFKSPLSDFQRRVAEAGLAGKVRYLERGERFNFGLPWPLVGDPASRGAGEEYNAESASGEHIDVDRKTA